MCCFKNNTVLHARGATDIPRRQWPRLRCARPPFDDTPGNLISYERLNNHKKHIQIYEYEIEVNLKIVRHKNKYEYKI
jgi:hypothetical protein